MVATRTSGQYVAQPTGYRAFIPAPLPPEPPPAIDAGMQTLLSRADLALGRLDGAIQTLPNPDLFVFMYARKEAVLSSQIEGTQASLRHLLDAEAEVVDPDRPRDVDEVVNYVAAMRHGLERLTTLPVSLRLLREIHERLMRGVRGANQCPGEFRTTQNWIGAPGAKLREAVFVPPPPDRLPDVLTHLERFLHADIDMPPLIRIGLAHAQFETIHPFLDGNGRVGRLLITLLLCENRILTVPVLYLSYYLRRHRIEYYDRLQATRDAGDWAGWLAFFLTGVAEVAGGAAATARRIVMQREDLRRRIMGTFGRSAGNGLRLLEHLYTRPVISVTAAAEMLDVSFPPAGDLVGRLEEAGIVTEITGHRRNRRFRFDPYLDLFEDGTGVDPGAEG